MKKNNVYTFDPEYCKQAMGVKRCVECPDFNTCNAAVTKTIIL